MLMLHPAQPCNCVWPGQVRLGFLSPMDKLVQVAISPFALVACSGKLVPRVLPYGFEQAVARFAVGLVGLRQRLVHELRQQVDDRSWRNALARADGFRGLQVPAAGENRKTLQEFLFAR